MICCRPAWMASGSLLLPISRAMSASLGKARAWARKAGSRLSSAAAASSASISAASHSAGCPALALAAAATRFGKARSFMACQRAKRSLSMRAIWARSVRRLLEMQVDRCGKAAVERQDRARRRCRKRRRSACARRRCSTSPVTSAPVTPVVVASEPFSSSRPTRSGMCIGSLLLWPGVGGTICSSDSVRVCCRCIIGAGSGDQRRAGLVVPERELREVAFADFLEAVDEILDRHGLSVMPFEIEVHALAEQHRAPSMVAIMRVTSEPFS